MQQYETPDHRICLHDVHDGDVRHLPTLLRLMPEFFPHCEKFLPSLERDARRPVTAQSSVVPHQWIVEVDGDVAGFYIFDYRPQRDCGLSLFMGLYPQYRRIAVNGYERLSHFLFNASVRQACADAARFQRPTPPGLVGEIEIDALLERYLLYDFLALPVVYYEPMFPHPWIAMTEDLDRDAVAYERVTLGLFHDGQFPKRTLTADEVANLALAYLNDFYQLPDDSLPVREALASARPFAWTKEIP